MDYNELINSIFQIVIIPCLGILTGFFVKWLKTKTETLVIQTEDEKKRKYLWMLEETISSAVVAVNQTYVDSLKAQGKFDLEAQAKAFTMVYNQVLLMIGDEGKKYLSEITNDMSSYLTMEIEAAVNRNKTKIELK